MDEKVKKSAKQIFELAGQTLLLAQSMEKELAFLVMVPEITKNKRLPNLHSMSREVKKLDECTFGQLLEKLRNHAAMNDAMKKILKKALTARNLFVHDFFNFHPGWLGKISEHDIMRDELGEMRNLFELIYDKLQEESCRNLKNIGLFI